MNEINITGVGENTSGFYYTDSGTYTASTYGTKEFFQPHVYGPEKIHTFLLKPSYSHGYYVNNNIHPEVIALIGPIGSGKDYRTSVLEKEGYIKVSFADTLRNSVWRLLGWRPESDKEYRSFKNQIYGRGTFTGRDIMLQMEKEIKDREGEYVFINKTLEKIVFFMNQDSNNIKFVISDLRFLEEYESLKSYFKNLKIIFCNYKSSQYKLIKNSLSESLAVSFAELGMRDGQELRHNDFLLLHKAPEDFL
jgi:dephospho-CoA kinase